MVENLNPSNPFSKSHGFYSMGVINLTPDSFSDGGKYLSQKGFAQRLSDLGDCDILDIGAESTAPFNQKISSEEEISRWKDWVFELLKKHEKPNQWISIDTYQLETLNYIYQKLQDFELQEKIIWNDVSGVIDSQSIDFLKKHPKVFYIFSHTYVPRKELTQEHMNFVQNGIDIVSSVEQRFQEALDKLDFCSSRIILDPCFGFSKSYDQNLKLFKALPKLGNHFKNPILVGISRKSFLKTDSNQELLYLESKQSIYLHYLLQNHMVPILRVHDPLILKALEDSQWLESK